MSEWKLTIQGVKPGHWPTIQKKIYFKCTKCATPRPFTITPPTIHVPTKCPKCGHNQIHIPTRIPMGILAPALMLGIMLGFTQQETYMNKEATITLNLKQNEKESI